MLPKSFKDMPVEQAKLKYPMEQRPQIIKTNEGTDINFTFSLLEQPIANRQVKLVRDSLKRVLRSARPDMKFLENGLEEIEDHTIGWFEFISNGIDGKLYNMMYFTPIDGKLIKKKIFFAKHIYLIMEETKMMQNMHGIWRSWRLC